MFVTLNETTACSQVAITVNPQEKDAAAELFGIADVAEDLNQPTAASTLRNFAKTVKELAKPIQKHESADGTDNDSD